jgi:lipopolysaccharide transport system ATP-binding protein
MLDGLMRLAPKPNGDPNSDAIVVEGVSKRFRIPHERKITVYEHLIGLLRGGAYTYEEFNALQDVSFSVKHARPSA